MASGKLPWTIGLAAAVLLCQAAPAWSQKTSGLRPKSKPAAKSGEIRSTTVEIEILTEDGSGLRAQEWRSALEPLEIPFSVRRGESSEEPETKERTYGTLRKVTAIGWMDRSGKLTFADRVFEPGDRAKIKAWVADLQTYGAQGTPDGRPLWGLNEEQFTAVYNSLTEVTTVDLRDQPLEQAVNSLPLPTDYPVQWSPAARKRVKADEQKKAVVRQSTEGFTTATSLAILLHDHGLGFRPTRTPQGRLELLIDVPDKSSNVWPVGWPLKQPRQIAAPKLFALQQMFLDDKTVLDVLGMASEAAVLPVLFDYPELDRIDQNWADIPVVYPPRQATWHTVLRDVLNKGKLTFDLWQDEAGRPFLYITSLKSKRTPAK